MLQENCLFRVKVELKIDKTENHSRLFTIDQTFQNNYGSSIPLGVLSCETIDLKSQICSQFLGYYMPF